MLPSKEIFSPDPQARLTALQKYSISLAEASELSFSQQKAFEALLKLVIQEDPEVSVRCLALSVPQCPESILQHSLKNGSEDIRYAVIGAIGNRRSQPLFELLLQHIPLESSIKLKVFALKIFNGLLQRGYVPADLVRRALGIHPSPTIPLETFDYEDVLRDCAEHEERCLRSATSDVLVTLVAQDHRGIAETAFSLLQQLLRDGDARVAKDALSGMSRIAPAQHELKLSEKCVRAMLTRYHSVATRADLFRILGEIPCYSLRTYAIVQTFLRRRLYETEMKNRGEGKDVEELRQVLLSVARRNLGFVRVLDLKQSETHKMGRLLEP
ncbi:Armadillo-like helical domain containing protein [Gracilaria domingensis]|nr:Armadillo-like helical domain containing protein [Gracilaria domingensis]